MVRQLLPWVIIAVFGASSASATDRPNVLFILADDVGWGDIRSNNPGGKVALPAIERLAAEGVSFADAHTSAAKCAPSRYSILTGNYQWRGRLGWGAWNYKGGSQILPGQETIGDLLRRAGYSTAFVGKYHLGADFYRKGSNTIAKSSDADSLIDFSRAMLGGPNAKGFDYSYVVMRGIQDGPYAFFENDSLDGDPSQMVTWRVGDYGDTKIVAEGIGLPQWNTRQVGPTLLGKARGFISAHQLAQQSASEPRPFFMLLSTEAAHGPFKPPASVDGRAVLGASGLGGRTDMLIEIDAIVESLMRQLEELGIADNTLIVFASDNGGLRLAGEVDKGHWTAGDFRGDKGTIYEGGHRVPFILKWGQQAFGNSPLPRGSRLDGLVGIQDLFATLADLTGTPIADDQGRDSFSLVPMLMGQSAAVRTSIVHEADAAEDGSTASGFSSRHFAYRSGDWKLILNSSRVAAGLYDLAEDPFETSNLISIPGQADRIAQLRAALDSDLQSARTAPLPGDPPVLVPDVTGLERGVAESAILDAGLAVGAVTELPSAVVPAGAVISQDPLAGTFATAGAPVSIVISLGDIPSPDFSLTPPDLVFAAQLVGTASDPRIVTLSSVGTSPLTLGSIRLTGANASQFSQTHNCPASIAAGGSCEIVVRFTPTSAGTKVGTLLVEGEGGATARQVNLSGTGAASSISVTPASLTFGDQARGTVSAARTVSVRNTGNAPLPINSITLGGSNPKQFRQSNDCPAQIAAGATCSIQVTFNPTARGIKTARLRINVGNGIGTKNVSLTGTGV